MSHSPTSLSLETLREMGYTAQVVEYWHHKAKVRVDLFGCIDIIAVHPEHGILAVQATTTGNAAARAAKAREKLPPAWLKHAKFEVWGWALRGKAGKRKTWTLNRRGIEP